MSLMLSRRRALAFAPALALATSLPVTRWASAEADRRYVVIDLGVLEGGDYSIGHAVNKNGVVAGMARAGTTTEAVVLRDLELLTIGATGQSSAANDINADGVAVGYVSDPAIGGQHAVRWEDGEQLDLGTLGGPSSVARAINDKGDIVGDSTTDGGAFSRAFLWHDGQLQDLGTLGGEFSLAMDINGDGVIVGLSTSAPDQQPYGPGTRATMWGEEGMIDLGSLGGDVAAAAAVNSKGWVAGGATTDPTVEYGGPGTHAFLWKEGEIYDLGAFDGADFSVANGINKDGEVVGFAGNPNAENPDDSMTAALWDKKGNLVNLNDAISPDDGWYLITAMSINDKGLITGLGVSNGQYRGFLLQPKK
jgi:probable HAF family extracellular repeat protein